MFWRSSLGIPPLCDISVSGSSALFGSNHQLVVWEQPSICCLGATINLCVWEQPSICLFVWFIYCLSWPYKNQSAIHYFLGRKRVNSRFMIVFIILLMSNLTHFLRKSTTIMEETWSFFLQSAFLSNTGAKLFRLHLIQEIIQVNGDPWSLITMIKTLGHA